MQRTVIFGNSGSGKSTLAKALAESSGCAHFDLDTIAWEAGVSPPTRRAIEASRADILAFMHGQPGWVIEGCYADLLELAMEHASNILFLNPGVETCIENAWRRPWEPHKYESKEAQDANLDMLIDWIRDYDKRDDEFSCAAHRRLFDSFAGQKRELLSNLRDPASVVSPG